MRRALGIALSFVLPLMVGGAVLAALKSGRNVHAEGWLRTASYTVFPAAVANLAAAWIVALRPGASPPADTFGALLRACLTFLLAVPLMALLAAGVLWLLVEHSPAVLAVGALVAGFAAPIGVLPMTLLQWLAYHFTLDRKTA